MAQIRSLSRSVMFGAAVALVLGNCAVNAQNYQRRVLLLYPYDDVHPSTAEAGAGMRKRLVEKSPSKLDIYTDFLDLARFPTEADELRSAHHLADKYASKPLDLIVALNSEAEHFLLKYRSIIAPNVPIVFCCARPEVAMAADRPANVTGVFSEFDANKTIALAQQLQPDARNLIIVSGSSEIDQGWLKSLRTGIEPYEHSFNIEYWVGLPYETLLERASHLSRDTIVIFITVYGDGTGRPFVPALVVEALATAASAPVYGPSDTYLGRGIVGGHMSSFESMGADAADMALEILAGRDPAMLAPRSSENRKFQVDARQLLRWHIPERNIPKSTLVSFRQPTIWEEHRNLVLATIFVILLQAIMITALLVQMLARRRAEKWLRESEERWRSVFEMSTVGIALADRNFRFQATNTAFQKMFGRTDEQLHGLTPLDLSAEEERESLKLLFEQVHEGKQQSYESVQRYKRKDGALIWVHAYVSRMQDNESEAPLFLATAIDVTGRKRAEAASRDALSDLARVTRLTTMGEMTASIAHEINQPLGAIVTGGSAGLRWLANAKPDLEEARACFRRIVNDGHRASQVINGIRTMLVKGDGERELLDINGLVREVLVFAHAELENKGIMVRAELNENLPEVLVDRIQLQQVVLNLVLNGIDAMAALSSRPRVLKLRSERNGSANLIVTVEDSGTGIDRSIISQIFEAFFTTKRHGIGMGLSICRSIAVAHGGQLSVSSGYPYGSVFRLELPANQLNAA
ncbi:MAG: PAS domain S-box protein [Bradyrhizobium sp.]|uniref:ABC transporter substrate binding protein n=1 Tax=Bradyrhizobium sp. TaxID=376 RepID=UPI0012185F2C|nr:ABC transporter substrate binding protein [Bradyrhizobium sp.]THD61919.1 MAG: PAS domain S-box protein [Bradyrhizobium sp.]